MNNVIDAYPIFRNKANDIIDGIPFFRNGNIQLILGVNKGFYAGYPTNTSSPIVNYTFNDRNLGN